MRRVRYDATGLEGTDFTVDIGTPPMASDEYTVIGATCGLRTAEPLGTVPIMDFPAEPGDRTTTTFRVVTADVLSAGDKLAFLIVQ